MEIKIIGTGMGGKGTLTAEALGELERARLIIGAKRVLDSLPDTVAARRVFAVHPSEIFRIINDEPPDSRVCVAMSGDTGFYSGAKKLLPLLEGHKVSCICGISTVQYLAARLGRSWQDALLVSAHGIDCNIIGNVLSGSDVFFLTGGEITPRVIIERLVFCGLSEAEVTVGECLSYPDERIITGTAASLQGREFKALSAVWVRSGVKRRPLISGGIPDGEFIRGDTPMTKQEVRAAALAKLGLQEGGVIYDIGAGTGSVAVELALLSPMAQVFAIERDSKACALIAENREKFGAYNINLINGEAPGAFLSLPAPDRAFIGGSGGNMRPVLEALLDKNPSLRVCVAAIALETVGEAANALGGLGFEDIEAAQISVSRSVAAGRYNLMTGLNPVFLFSATGGGAR